MKIVSYNVNGLRSALTKGFAQWVAQEQPDVLCLQELKLHPEQYPEEIFTDMGYHSHFLCAQKKGYSGVAILSKQQPDFVAYGMGIEKYDAEGRFLRADIGDLSVVSVYHPSGTSGEKRQSFKMTWLEDFQCYILELQKKHPKLLLCGDFNICHKPIDIHDPIRNANSSGFLPEEREWMCQFLDSGFIDSFRFFNQKPHYYTWWSFRANARNNNKGWRIDYCMASLSMKPFLKNAAILTAARHSDHCPTAVEII